MVSTVNVSMGIFQSHSWFPLEDVFQLQQVRPGCWTGHGDYVLSGGQTTSK